MNERTYEYHYIPPCIFRAWADSREYVSFFFNKCDGEVHEAPYSPMYYEDIIPECPKREFADAIRVPVLSMASDCLTK